MKKAQLTAMYGEFAFKHVGTPCAFAWDWRGKNLWSAVPSSSGVGSLSCAEVESGQELMTIEASVSTTATIADNRDKNGIYLADVEGLSEFDARTGKLRQCDSILRTPVDELLVSHDGERLVRRSSDASVQILQTGRNRIWATVNPGGPIALSPDRRMVLCISKQEALLIELEDGSQQKKLRHPLHSLASAVHYAERSLQSRVCIAAEHELVCCSFEQKEPLWKCNTTASVRALATKGEHLFVLGSDGSIETRSLEKGTLLQTARTDALGRVSFSHDGTRMAFARGTTTRVWNTQRAREEDLFTGHRGAIRALGSTRDGKRFASGDETGLVVCWLRSNGTIVWMLEGHTAPIVALCWLSDGVTLASADAKAQLRLWNTSRGTELAVLSLPLETDEQVLRISATQDGTTLTLSCGKRQGNQQTQTRSIEVDASTATILSSTESVRAMLPSNFVSDDGNEQSVRWERAQMQWHRQGKLYEQFELANTADLPTCAAWLPDHRSVLFGTARGVVLQIEEVR